MITAHPNHALISSEDVEGTAVFNRKGDKIGEIDHLMINKVSGHVTYAVMSFGGFLKSWVPSLIGPRGEWTSTSKRNRRRSTPASRAFTTISSPSQAAQPMLRHHAQTDFVAHGNTRHGAASAGSQ